MDLNFLLKTAASGLAIALLVALAAWARIARPTPALDEAAVRDLLAFEAPDAKIGQIWIAADAHSALARAGADAIFVFRLGDGYVTRSALWTEVSALVPTEGAIDLPLAGVGAARARFTLGDSAAWPPALEAAA